MQLQVLQGLPQEGNGIVWPFHGMGCYVPISMSDVQIGCLRENLLMVLVIVCWLPHTTLTELQNRFVCPEDVKWRGVHSAIISCFIAEMRDEQHTLTIPASSFQRSKPSLPTTMQSSRWSVESKGLGHEGSLAWGLTNIMGLLDWPWLHAHPWPLPSPGHWNFLADDIWGYFSAHALSNCTWMKSFGEQQDRCH